MDFIVEYKLADESLRKVVIRQCSDVAEALAKASELYPDINTVLSVMPAIGL